LYQPLNQKMDVDPVMANLQKVNLVTHLYFRTNIIERGRNLRTQNFSTIFDSTDKMIKKQAFAVTPVNMFAHTHKCNYPCATPEAEPRGILLIKN